MCNLIELELIFRRHKRWWSKWNKNQLWALIVPETALDWMARKDREENKKGAFLGDVSWVEPISMDHYFVLLRKYL